MDSSAAPPGPAEGGAAAPSEAGPAASPGEDQKHAPAPQAAAPRSSAQEGEDIQIVGLVDLDSETGAELPPSAPEAAPAPPVMATPAAPWSPSMWLLGVITFVVAAADIGSKEWAKHALAGPDLKRTGKHIEVIKDHLDFIFAQNPGGAWSFLRGVPDGLRRPFFLFVSAAAIVFIVMVYRRLDRRQWAMKWGLPLALGGAIGNLADRVRYGWVVDFIDVYWRGQANEMHWPTFNVADIAIVFGVGFMALDLFSLRKMNDPSPQEAATEAAGGAA